MALTTRCPRCSTKFRVASDQLKLRGGIVRCGACQEVFDGNAALIGLDALADASGNTEALAVVPTEGSLPPQETDTDGAHPAPAETATDAVVPAQAGTHADDNHPAPDDAVTDAVVPAEGSAPPQATPLDATVPAASGAPDLDSEPIYTLDFDSTFDPFGILPKADAPETIETADAEAAKWAHADLAEPEPAPEPSPAPAAPDSGPQPPVEPEFDLPIDEELIAAPLPDDDLHDTEPAAAPAAVSEAPTPASPPVRAPLGSDFPYTPAASIPPRAGPRTKPGRRSKLIPTKIAPPKLRVPEIDEPEFVKRSRQQEQTGKTRRILIAVGAALLLLALAAQAVVSFRNVWAARFPAAKPALVTACALLGCRVQLPTQIDNLAIETGELQTLGANAYSLTTQLRNNGDLVQAWPNIELALNDANDKPLLRRVFTPAEYLAPGARPGTGFAPRAEQPIKLYFELDQLKPSGYHIAVFYP
jgi:predicted Zn finger-like uncharacterized protein